MTAKLLILLLVVVVAAGGFWFLVLNQAPYNLENFTGQEGQEEAPEQQESAQSPSPSVPQVHQATYTDEGYEPRELTVGHGEVVSWRNESSQKLWVATAVHPTHTAYPGSSINRCGTAEEGEMFDACQGIDPGSSWGFQFLEVGEWGYHNHLQPSHTGKIIVD